jgi:hypothetical protein
MIAFTAKNPLGLGIVLSRRSSVSSMTRWISTLSQTLKIVVATLSVISASDGVLSVKLLPSELTESSASKPSGMPVGVAKLHFAKYCPTASAIRGSFKSSFSSSGASAACAFLRASSTKGVSRRAMSETVSD